MSRWREYDEEYETMICWTCSDCDTTYEDVEVTVHGGVAVVECLPCDSHGIEIEVEE
jgi:hypothetical protein